MTAPRIEVAGTSKRPTPRSTPGFVLPADRKALLAFTEPTLIQG